MKERIEILERDYLFQIGWYFPDEGEFVALSCHTGDEAVCPRCMENDSDETTRQV